jgi:hypothetical protein
MVVTSQSIRIIVFIGYSTVNVGGGGRCKRKRILITNGHRCRGRYLSDCEALNKPRNLLDLDALINYMEESNLEGQQLDPTTFLETQRRIFLTANSKLRREQELRMESTKARFLARQCQPKRWLDSKNRPIEMLTLRNQVAREFMSIYDLLREKNPNTRMENLQKVGN